MTRQIFILILSIGVVVFGGIWESKYLEQSCNFVLSDIEYIENVLNNDNIGIAKVQIKEVENSWDNVKDSWNIFVQNDLIDQIDNILVELKGYIEVGNKEESIVCLNKLKSNLLTVVNRQKISTENVF